MWQTREEVLYNFVRDEKKRKAMHTQGRETTLQTRNVYTELFMSKLDTVFVESRVK